MKIKILLHDLNISKKFYKKVDDEKKIDHIEYARVTTYVDCIECMYEFQNEYVITLKSGYKIQVSKEEYEYVKGLY